MRTIQSPHNDQLKHLGKLLQQAKYRRQNKQTVLEGSHLLDALLRSGRLPEKVYLPESRLAHPETAALLVRLPEHIVNTVAETAYAKIGAHTEERGILTLVALPESAAEPQSDCIMLDRIQDPGNLGNILRSAAAAGIPAALLSEGCVDAYSPKVLRAGMGAHFLICIREHVPLADCIRRFPNPVFATALAPDSRPLYQTDLRRPCAWLFGNEGSGIAPELSALACHTVRIPMAGSTESLNVAAAAAICLFEQVRQRQVA